MELREKTSPLAHFRRLGLLIACLPFFVWGCAAQQTNPLRHAGDTISSPSFTSGDFRLDTAAEKNAMANTQQALNRSNAIEQKMVYAAHVDLTVQNYKRVQAELEQIASRHQAYMVAMRESKNPETQKADFTYRVPKNRFQSFLKTVQTMEKGSAPQVRIQGQDVTEEMVDLESRLKAKESMEKRLLDLMNQAKEARDLLEISRQLEQIHSDIERIKGRLQYLNNRVDYSTVHIHLTQPIVNPSSPELPLGAQMIVAFRNSVAGIGVAIQHLFIFVSGAIPILFVLGLAGLPVAYAVRKRKAGKNGATE